jgi:hypothetical protein
MERPFNKHNIARQKKGSKSLLGCEEKWMQGFFISFVNFQQSWDLQDAVFLML